MSTRPPFGPPLETLFTELVNTVTNASLKLDPLSEPRLRALQGRRIHLVAELPAVDDKTFTVLITDGRLEIVPYAAPDPNAIVRGSIPDLLGWFVRGAAGQGRVDFEGDETVLHELSEVLHGYSPDVTEPIAGLVGGDVAANLLSVAEGAMATLRSALEGAGTAVQKGTAQRYVTRSNLNAFLDMLDDARSRADRLAQRVAAGEQQRTSS